MIHDGYSRRVTLGQLHVIYRPAIKDERLRLSRDLSFVSESAAEDFAGQWLASRIELWDGNTVDSLINTDYDKFSQLLMVVLGTKEDDGGLWKDLEEPWRKNLYEGVKMDLENPLLARRSCEDCKKWWYGNDGQQIKNPDGTPIERVGPTMCQTIEGCDKGTPDNQRSLNSANQWAWRHFRNCEAILSFPPDTIVARNAFSIRKAINDYERERSVKNSNGGIASRTGQRENRDSSGGGIFTLPITYRAGSDGALRQDAAS